jgi:hypothetical protein
VKKTSLGAEATVNFRQFGFTSEAVAEAKKLGLQVFAAEITPDAMNLQDISLPKDIAGVAVIF